MNAASTPYFGRPRGWAAGLMRSVGQAVLPWPRRPLGPGLVPGICTGEYSGRLAASSEIDELAWFGYADRPRVPPVDQLLFDDLHAAGELR